MPAVNIFLHLTTTLKSLYHSGVNRWSEMTNVGNKRTHNPSVPGSSPGCPTFLFGFIRLKLSWLQQSIQISLKHGSHPWTTYGPLAYNNWR
jgi:hypothetical protein